MASPILRLSRMMEVVVLMKILYLVVKLVIFLSVSVTGCSSSNPERQSSMFDDSVDGTLDYGEDLNEGVGTVTVYPTTDDQSLNDASSSGLQALRVKHHMVECEGYQVTHCLVTRLSDGDEWSYFYDAIEGFDYRWGYDYDIVVQVKNRKSSSLDGFSERYRLVEVVSAHKVEVDPTFEYVTRNSSQRIKEISPNRFSLLGNKLITCSEDVCQSLRSAIAQKHAALLSLQHSTNPDRPLILTAVLCAESAVAFNGSCI